MQETMNYWKQLTHVMKYFRTEEDEKAQLPKNFINGFLEVSALSPESLDLFVLMHAQGRN